MKSRTVSLEGNMKTWSSAVGLIFLFILNGVSLMPNDPEATILSEETRSYCLQDNCPADSDKPHYGCNNTENWSASCGETPELITITEKIKMFLVSSHNTFRDTVASGTLLKLPAAGRMCKLSWDPDLANVAKLLIMRCELRPSNSCISTMKFPAPGYNAMYHKFKKKQDAYTILRSQLNAWYDQYKVVEPLSILDGSSSYESKMGNFQRMMVGPSNRLGCAMAATERDGWKQQWLTCLYSCSPKKNTLLYEYAAKPGNFCTTGVDTQFQHLCSDQEAVDACRPTPLFNMAITNDTAAQIRAIMKSYTRSFVIPNGYHPVISLYQPAYSPVMPVLQPVIPVLQPVMPALQQVVHVYPVEMSIYPSVLG